MALWGRVEGVRGGGGALCLPPPFPPCSRRGELVVIGRTARAVIRVRGRSAAQINPHLAAKPPGAWKF